MSNWMKFGIFSCQILCSNIIGNYGIMTITISEDWVVNCPPHPWPDIPFSELLPNAVFRPLSPDFPFEQFSHKIIEKPQFRGFSCDPLHESWSTTSVVEIPDFSHRNIRMKWKGITHVLFYSTNHWNTHLCSSVLIEIAGWNERWARVAILLCIFRVCLLGPW